VSRRSVVKGCVLALFASGVALAERPDGAFGGRTLAPRTVQLEGGAAEWSRDRDGGLRVTTWTLGATTVRAGVRDRVELQVAHDGWIDERTRDTVTATTARARGWGDVTLRAKVNLHGNDDGDVAAWAVLPAVKLPTADAAIGNGAVEGGVAALFEAPLGELWTVEAFAELAAVRNAADTAHRAACVCGAVFTRGLSERWEGFFEAELATGEGRAAAVLGAGLSVALGARTLIEAGARVGATRAADDLAFFAGWAHRF